MGPPILDAIWATWTLLKGNDVSDVMRCHAMSRVKARSYCALEVTLLLLCQYVSRLVVVSEIGLKRIVIRIRLALMIPVSLESEAS